MSNPPNLHEAMALARHDHPPTAHQAAARVAPRTGTMRHTILTLLDRAPATDEELWHRTGYRQDSARPRRVELVSMGYVEASDDTRLTDSGALAIVWRITAAGRAALR
jgi:hypothetical protein